MTTTTTTSNQLREYKDLDMNFIIHPIKKDINKVVGEKAIINSIKNLLLTNHYERPFQPHLGSNIRKLLFEPLDALVARSLEIEIRTVLQNFEPRVKIISIRVSPQVQQNAFQVTLEFQPLNTLAPITITFFLERVR
jgi:phage baseplate assembly protein W